MLRHHRLLELYLARTLELGLDAVHARRTGWSTCSPRPRGAHRQGPRLADLDPHGDPIPDATLRILRPETRRLTELLPGDRATVQGIPDGDGELVSYLSDLGLVPGEPVELVRAEPLGGPLTVRAGRRVAISRELADEIRVSG
jgi:DtxR family Mn-dependent transcriptional regulator